MEQLLAEALTSRFDPQKKDTPYKNENEYIHELASLVSLYLICAFSYKSACAESVQAGVGARNLPDSAMTLDEAISHVSDYAGFELPVEPQVTEMIRLAREHIDSRVAAGEKSGMVLHTQRLRALFGLSDFAFFAVACALSCTLDRGFERLFISLHGDEEMPFPTLGAVHACYSVVHQKGDKEWRQLLDLSLAENRLLFSPPPAGKPPYLRPLALSPIVLGYIMHSPCLSRELGSCGELLEPGGDGPLFTERQVEAARTAIARMRLREEPRLCVLCGAAGSGKKLTLRRIALEDGVRFLFIRQEEAPEISESLIDEMTAAAMLWGYIPCVSVKDAAGSAWLMHMLSALKPWKIGAVLVTEQLRSNIVMEGLLVTRIDYPAPKLEQALYFWRLFSSGYATAPSVDWTRIAATYRLAPGRIKSALHTACEISETQKTLMDDKIISSAVLLGNTGRLSEIADKIDVFYDWDDLVLGDIPKRMLRDVCDRVRYRHLVETEWGFGGKKAYGNGVSILLYGPPGTGKTMSAQVIAGELGLPLYRINLAQIISKYIGETAKNLDSVFNEAKNSNVILFFDEADALFAKRTDVKNSNDRHANSESSYLLQKIEEYCGISILATNLASNFDEAFRRRISYMINIHMPSPEQRLKLWRGAFPEKAPISPNVDLKLFADNLEFSGSVIKSAVLQAAYFAAAEGAQIDARHIVRAVRRELLKLGKSEPHFLNIYQDDQGNK